MERNVEVSIVIRTNGSLREIRHAKKDERQFMERMVAEIATIAAEDIREQLAKDRSED